jgi:hypothetical protein
MQAQVTPINVKEKAKIAGVSARIFITAITTQQKNGDPEPLYRGLRPLRVARNVRFMKIKKSDQ